MTITTTRAGRLAIAILASAVAAATLTVGVAESASAATPKPGAKCKKVGLVTSNGLICKRKNGKKVFVRVTTTSGGSTSGSTSGGTQTPTSPEFTAAEKEQLKTAFQQALTGKQVDRTFTENNSLTQLIWHLCPGDRYGLVSNLSFSGSGSTTSTEVGTWKIAQTGGIRGVAEAALLQMTPADPSIAPYTLEIDAFADGHVEANGRNASISPSGEC